MPHDAAFTRLAAAPDLDPDAPNLSVGFLLRSGWGTFRTNLWLLLGTDFVLTIFVNACQYFMPQAGPNAPLPTQLFLIAASLVFFFLIILLLSGQCLQLLRAVRGRAAFTDLFAAFPKGGRLLLLALLLMLLFSVGLGLFVIPGVILILGLSFAPLIAMESPLGAFRSIRASWRLTAGHKRRLFLYGATSALISLPLYAVLIFLIVLGMRSGLTSRFDLATMQVLASLAAAPLEMILIGGLFTAYEELLKRFRAETATAEGLPAADAPATAAATGAPAETTVGATAGIDDDIID